MRPVEFERELLCVTQQLTRQPGCSGPTSFDAIDSHPYGIGGPNWHAYWADDVSIPDVHKLVSVLHAAERLGTSMPHGPKGNWVTETSWDTDPPDPHGVPINEQARWLEQALFNLWKQGVSTVLWWQIVDCSTHPELRLHLPGRRVLPEWAGETQRHKLPLPVRHLADQLQDGDDLEPSAHQWCRLDPGPNRWRLEDLGEEYASQPIRSSRYLSHLIFRETLRAKIGSDTSLPWAQSG